MRVVRDPKIDVLASLPLFVGVSEKDLAAVAAAADRVTVARHTELTTQGDRAEFVYVIVDGIAQVRRGADVVAYLGAGDVVGELGVLTGERRTATVTTIVDTDLFVVDRRHLAPLLDRTPEVAARLEEIAAPRRAA